MFNFQKQNNKYKLYNLSEALNLDDFDNNELIGQQTQSITDFDAFDIFINDRILNFNKEPLSALEVSLIERINNDKNDYYTGRLQVADQNQLKLALQRTYKYFGMNGNYNWVDTSQITSFSNLFQNIFGDNRKDFNGDISKWNTGNVKYMLGTFNGCTSLKCDISNWDFSNVKYFTSETYANTNIEFKRICDEIFKKLKANNQLIIRKL